MSTERRTKSENVKRLAKDVSQDKARSRVRRPREGVVRAESRGDTGRTVGDEREVSPLARLMGALRKEKVRFLLIGMSAAIVQGVPGSTIDIDIWIDLPPRQYMKAMNIAVAAGGKAIRNTVVELEDRTLVNFVYEVTGLGSFASEYKRAKKIKFHSMQVPVLPLESIRKSKLAIGRPKDLTHVKQIEDTLKLKKAEKKTKKSEK